MSVSFSLSAYVQSEEGDIPDFRVSRPEHTGMDITFVAFLLRVLNIIKENTELKYMTV